MSATVLYMSLDGFITGRNAGPGTALGDGGERLHEWVFKRPDARKRPGFDEFMAAGATVTGRGTFEPGGDHHHGLPIWVSRREPGIDASQWPPLAEVRPCAMR